MAIDDIATGDKLAQLAAHLPRPARFVVVGGIGLLTDLCAFTVLLSYTPHPLAMRLVSLGLATLVTWRLNRALTFAPSARAQHHEAVRYAIVTAVAQGTSYAVFAALVLALPTRLPQLALLAGAAIGAFVSYHGHRLFAFAPASLRTSAPEGVPHP